MIRSFFYFSDELSLSHRKLTLRQTDLAKFEYTPLQFINDTGYFILWASPLHEILSLKLKINLQGAMQYT
jgi:hypothetical protein